MTPKELKRLSRSDLLEMLLQQSKENAQLRAEIAQLREELADRNIIIKESGSLAEAALKLNGIFESAQAACDQYMQNIRIRNEYLEHHCLSMIEKTREKCQEMLAQAQQEAEEEQEQYGQIEDLPDDGGSQ